MFCRMREILTAAIELLLKEPNCAGMPLIDFGGPSITKINFGSRIKLNFVLVRSDSYNIITCADVQMRKFSGVFFLKVNPCNIERENFPNIN